MTAKLGDFGFDKPLPKIPEGKIFIHTTCGTTGYMAPELSDENWEGKWMFLVLELQVYVPVYCCHVIAGCTGTVLRITCLCVVPADKLLSCCNPRQKYVITSSV